MNNESVTIELENSTLWNLFHQHGNEMIITKVGRRLFPSIDIKISNLDPEKLYSVCVDFPRLTKNRFKYSPNIGWTTGRPSDVRDVSCMYRHPKSPAPGSFWMSTTIIFDKVLFSNSTEVQPNVIVLSSMHKYIPRILIYEASIGSCYPPVAVQSFLETSFIAVTAYQNSSITNLKVQNNKYANGHRIKHSEDKKKEAPSGVSLAKKALSQSMEDISPAGIITLPQRSESLPQFSTRLPSSSDTSSESTKVLLRSSDLLYENVLYETSTNISLKIGNISSGSTSISPESSNNLLGSFYKSLGDPYCECRNPYEFYYHQYGIPHFAERKFHSVCWPNPETIPQKLKKKVKLRKTISILGKMFTDHTIKAILNL